jgi:hypothetical protein
MQFFALHCFVQIIIGILMFCEQQKNRDLLQLIMGLDQQRKTRDVLQLLMGLGQQKITDVLQLIMGLNQQKKLEMFCNSL